MKKLNAKKKKAQKKLVKPDLLAQTLSRKEQKESAAWAKRELGQAPAAPKKVSTLEEARLLARRLHKNYGRTLDAVKEAETFLLWASRYDNEFGRKAKEVLSRMTNYRYGLPVSNPFSVDSTFEYTPKWLERESPKSN